jgi:hypothetical protein
MGTKNCSFATREQFVDNLLRFTKHAGGARKGPIYLVSALLASQAPVVCVPVTARDDVGAYWQF